MTDVGISGALPPALAFSVLLLLLPLTRLAVRSARREPGGRAAFPCSITIRVNDLGPLFTPADFVRGRLLYRALPYLRAFWLKPVSLFGLLSLTVLPSIQLF